MKPIHLTDQQLEQYISEPSACDDDLLRHLQHCPQCRKAADAFRVFFSELKHQKEASFDFDLSLLVLNQLKQEQPARANNWATLILCLLLPGLGTPLVYFSLTAIVNTNRTGTMVPWLIICSVILLFTGLGVDNYRVYQKRLLQLN